MQSFNRKFYSFRADANALGGFLEEPFEKNIPTLAPVSLPAVGGFAMARSEAFTLDEIVSCSSAYTRVSGRQHADGSVSILVTAVVEGLNLLEVVTARRVVAQLSISVPSDDGPTRFSLTGSRFEGLQLAGCECRPKLNPVLHQCGEGGRAEALTWTDIEQVARAQAESLIQGFQGRQDGAHEWAQKRHQWRTRDPQRGKVLCSLVDGFEGADPKASCGHIVEIPGFGRIILGELLVTPDSVQLIAIRADLGCPVSGGLTICCPGGGGSGDN
jgi:hypothetical protein